MSIYKVIGLELKLFSLTERGFFEFLFSIGTDLELQSVSIKILRLDSGTNRLTSKNMLFKLIFLKENSDAL
jgi:hypothetical protein